MYGNQMNYRKNAIKKFVPMWLAFAVMATLGCQAPIELTNEGYGSLSKAKSYAFDVVVISEWGGAMLPSEQTFMFYMDDSNYYRPDVVDLNYENGEIALDENGVPTLHEDSKDYMLPLPESLMATDNNYQLEKISLEPVHYGDHVVDIECTQVHGLDAGTEMKLKAMIHQSDISGISAYECQYQQSGAYNLSLAWDGFKNDHQQIHVGDGDSFGLSQRVSMIFNDWPATQTLNALGLDVDTFGNHSFDNSAEYLKEAIKISNYQYVAANLNNAARLGKVTDYAFFDIFAENEADNPLRVAVVGVLDSETMSAVTAGSFGTTSINSEFCVIAQALETAYNKNARAFVLTSHLVTIDDSLTNFFDALFSLANSDYIDDCSSKLVVPSERLKEVFNVATSSQLNLNDPEIEHKYLELIAKIRSEIFNSIVAVVGEGYSEPRIIPFYYNETLYNNSKCTMPKDYGALPFCRSGAYDELSQTTEQNKFIEYMNHGNILMNSDDNSKSEYCQLRLSPSLPCYHLDVLNSQNATQHRIYFIQLPTAGNYTARLSVQAILDENIPVSETNASTYKVDATAFDIVPVISHHAKVPYQDGSASFDLYAPSVAECTTFFKKNSYIKQFDTNNKCLAYLDYFSNDKTISSFASLKSDEVEGYDDYLQCYRALNSLSDSEIDIPDKVSTLSAAWTCLYQASVFPVCDGSFYEAALFEFNDYVTSNRNFDRSMSTYRTSMIADAIFNYVEKTTNVSADVGLMNAGNVRQVDMGRLTDAVIETATPFANTVEVVQMTAPQLMDVINSALYRGLATGDFDYGGFPVLSRLLVAFEIDHDTDRAVIHEAWLVDKYGALIEPIYLTLTPDNKGVVCSTREGASCAFGTYSVADTEVSDIVQIKVTPNPKMLCISSKENTQYTECSVANATMTFDLYRSVEVVNEKESSGSVAIKLNEAGNAAAVIKVLTNSFLTTDGDEYRLTPYTSTSVYTQDDVYITNLVMQYFTPAEFNPDEDKIDVCASVGEFKTVDGLSPDDFSCILNYNRLFESGELADTRWISKTANAHNVLDSTCSPENVSALKANNQ